MSEAPRKELITIDGTNVAVERPASPIAGIKVLDGGHMLQFINLLDDKYHPDNYNKADGAPLRILESKTVKIDLSKRSKEDMGFWHRNVDCHEVIICFQGALRWETELGTVTLHAGEMIVIPKGITHRSALCDESEDENILIELKLRDGLTYVGDNK